MELGVQDQPPGKGRGRGRTAQRQKSKSQAGCGELRSEHRPSASPHSGAQWPGLGGEGVGLRGGWAAEAGPGRLGSRVWAAALCVCHTGPSFPGPLPTGSSFATSCLFLHILVMPSCQSAHRSHAFHASCPCPEYPLC